MTDASPSGETPLGFTLWAVFRRDPARHASVGDLSSAVTEVEASAVTVRGWYDVSGLRADADLMVWLHGAVPEDLQAAPPPMPSARTDESFVPPSSPARSAPRFYPYESAEVLNEMTENLRNRVDNWHGLDFSR